MNQPLRTPALIAIAVLVLLGGGVGVVVYFRKSAAPEQVFCTMEAKLCPDGSYVGRTGQKCEFSPCPAQGAESSWKVFTDSKLGVSFKYPETLTATYIHTVDWPPKVQVINEPLACTEAGSEIGRAGKTERRDINGQTYCVTKLVEGAAGSTYTQYAYAEGVGGKTVILTFTIQAPQCMNYDEPQQDACKNEQSAFEIDGTINRVFTTLTIGGGSPPPSASGRQGIRGTVLLGPTCPVERIPPDPQCAEKHYATKLAVTTADQSRVIKELSSDTSGTFSVDLPPGTYIIRPAETKSMLPRCSPTDRIKVAPNTYTETTVYCDTGIR